LHHLKRAKLKLVNQYIIPFTGLKDGDHKFTFVFENEFFDDHEVLEAHNGKIYAEVVLNKKPGLLTLKVCLSGYLEITCDRCLENFQLPVLYDGNLIIKFGDDKSAATDEIWILYPTENLIDLEQFFYECIGLCIPIKRVHPDNEDGSYGCDPGMIEVLNTHSGNNASQNESDPRWNKLKDLLNDININ